MATDPLQSGAFGFANGGPVADPFDFSGIAPTPPTTAENLQDPYDFSGIPATPYQQPTRRQAVQEAQAALSVLPTPDAAYEQPVIAPYVAPVVEGARTPDNPTNPDPTDPDDPTTPDPTDPDTWTYGGHRGLRYQDGVLEIDPEYAATGYQGGDTWGWSQEDDQSSPSGYRDVFDPQEYLGMYYERLRSGRVDPIGGGYDIAREVNTDNDGNDIVTYRITGPAAASNAATSNNAAASNAAASNAATASNNAAAASNNAATSNAAAASNNAATTGAEWMNRLPQGLRYSGGRLEIDPAYSTGDPSGRRYGWSYDESSERDVFNPQDYLASVYDRMYGRRRGDIPALGGGYGISRETISSDDASDYNKYSITGPNMAGGGMIRGPSYLSGGIGSLGSTYLR